VQTKMRTKQRVTIIWKTRTLRQRKQNKTYISKKRKTRHRHGVII